MKKQKLFYIVVILIMAAKTTFAQYNDNAQQSRRKIEKIADNIYSNLTTRDCDDCQDKNSIKRKIIIGVANTYNDSLHWGLPPVNEANLHLYLRQMDFIWGNDVKGGIYIWKINDKGEFKPEMDVTRSGEQFFGKNGKVLIKIDGPLTNPRPFPVYSPSVAPAENPAPVIHARAPVIDQNIPVITEPAPAKPKADGGNITNSFNTTTNNYNVGQQGGPGGYQGTPWHGSSDYQGGANYNYGYNNNGYCYGNGYPRYSWNGGWYYYNNGWYGCNNGVMVGVQLHSSLCNAFGMSNNCNSGGYYGPHNNNSCAQTNTSGSWQGSGHYRK